MPPPITIDSDSDNGEMFITKKTNIISMYSMLDKGIQAPASDDENSSDEEEKTASPSQKRKLTSKRARGRPPSSKKSKHSPKTPPKPSNIIAISSDDDIPSISTTPDTSYKAAELSLSRAIAVIDYSEEGCIAADADAAARKDALAERACEAEKRWMEEQRICSKAAAASANEKTVILKVRAPQRTLKMKIRVRDPLKTMLAPFCKKTGIDITHAVLEVDGEEVDDADTAATFDLEDNMMVDVRLLNR